MKVSLFENALSAYPSGDVEFDYMAGLIGSTGFYEARIDELKKGDWQSGKKHLPCFTPAGRFYHRNDQGIKKYSGLVHLDYDKVDSVFGLKQTVSQIPFVYAAFISPSLRGLKVFVRTDSHHDDHLRAFTAINKLLEKVTGLRSDPRVRNLSRLCFVSCDRDLYFNHKAHVFPLEQYAPAGVKYTATIPDPDYQACDESSIFGYLYNFTLKGSYMGQPLDKGYQPGDRNNFIYVFACNCNRYGVPEHTAVEYGKTIWMHNQEGFTINELFRTVASAYKNIGEHGKFQLQEGLKT